ncbi:spermidine synthase [Oceanospirillum multiglobuliferum]|uniref:Polyamine aminopropyltransferase n=1 Tax=Oceanospirillum multiglobuliferum TaxID=64969 RepID=A0A1T4SMQ3_9GAMM|nr:polyamine aminopropyltransferase [Oceanospirillum multiglobuliferum]OPX54170.1 spermidine synthase [Oceanospirillum multiglobuliferum]SKA29433.1 spermidine synthase [Oceanospirillum multiglobuliferum]
MTSYLEKLYETYGQSFVIDEVLFEQQTDSWHLIIFRNQQFGTVMALDGIIQTTERDEFVYHEMLTHVPLFAHGAAKRVLIIGGGDGGILREVLKHPEVEHVTQVEIDQSVIDMCKTYLPKHSDGAFDNPRANIVIADGIEYVCNTDEKFDVIISDCTDPVGPGEVLFSSRFYEGCKRCLNEGGVFVAQNGSAFMQIDEAKVTQARLSPYFADQSFYCAAVPTYIGGNMLLAWGSDNAALRQLDLASLQARFAAANFKTRYYNPQMHQGALALPQFVLDALAE